MTNPLNVFKQTSSAFYVLWLNKENFLTWFLIQTSLQEARHNFLSCCLPALYRNLYHFNSQFDKEKFLLYIDTQLISGLIINLLFNVKQLNFKLKAENLQEVKRFVSICSRLNNELFTNNYFSPCFYYFGVINRKSRNLK